MYGESVLNGVFEVSHIYINTHKRLVEYSAIDPESV